MALVAFLFLLHSLVGIAGNGVVSRGLAECQLSLVSFAVVAYYVCQRVDDADRSIV